MFQIHKKSGFEMILKTLEVGALCVLAGKALLDVLCMTGVVDCDCDCCGCCLDDDDDDPEPDDGFDCGACNKAGTDA